MSPDDFKGPMEPNLFSEGEGYQDWKKVNPVKNGRDQNDDRSSHRHGVVCGHGMSGQVGVLKEEMVLVRGKIREPVRLVVPSDEIWGAPVGKEVG